MARAVSFNRGDNYEVSVLRLYREQGHRFPPRGGRRYNTPPPRMQCGKRFTTYEIIEDVPIIVVKKDKSREVFDRNKILKGMLRACEKRPVTVEALETAISEIETTLQSALDREVTSALLLFTRSLTAPVPLWTKFPNCNKPVSRPAFVGCFFLFYLGY